MVPPLNIGKTLAHFSCDGNCPLIILLFMSSVIDGNKISAANIIIFGPRPSMPVAFVESSLFMLSYKVHSNQIVLNIDRKPCYI